MILKQGRSVGRVTGHTGMSLERTSIEYDYMKIGRVIVPEYIPELYFYDDENLVFAVEDVSYLKISRFQMNKSEMFPKMAQQAADYLARMHFYTSDYYLDTETFRRMQIRFMNSKMRKFFDDRTFISFDCGEGDPTEEFGFELNPEYEEQTRKLILDPRVVLERHKLRDLYMRKAEALLHADFHTSNVFVSKDQLKAIDMEFTFFGPAAYDLGYLQANLLSQCACGAFRSFKTRQERLEFVSFILATMQQLFTEYCRVFFECWNKDAKPIYQGVSGLQEYVQKQLLQDMIGFCANSHIFRCAADIGYPEYDDLADKEAIRNAKLLSLIMDHRMILHREEYPSAEAWIDDMLALIKDFL
jgi:5-methylthioribose kinase